MKQTCKCKSDFIGKDQHREYKFSCSETKYRYEILYTEDFDIEPCECPSCQEFEEGILNAIQIEENDFFLIFPHEFDLNFITPQQERLLK